MKIDVHGHFYPPEYLEALRKLPDETKGPLAWGWKEIIGEKVHVDPVMSGNVDQRVRLLDEAGIDVQVLSLSTPNVFFNDIQESVRLARLCNDSYAEVQRQYPKRFANFATVPLPHVGPAIEEMERAIDELGMVGVCLGSNILGKPLDSPEFEPFWAELNRRGAVVFIHPMVPASAPVYADFDLVPMVGFLVDSTLAILRLIFSGVLERYPDVKIILPHLGGPALFLSQRIEDTYWARLTSRVSIKNPPSHYLKSVYYDCVSFHQPSVKCVYETVGADRMLLGTDFPFVSHGNLQRAVGSIQRLGLAAEETEKIMGTNAARLLKL